MTSSVSVVIPTYNFGRFIRDAIESVLAQTYPVDELIVIDDGSNDDTETVVSEFGPRVIYIKQQNAGVCAARNAGVARSRGELIAFLDADDIWRPEKIARQAARFDEDAEIGLVHCGMREFDGKTGETIATHLEGGEGWVAAKHVLFERPVINVSGSSIMVSRKVFEDVDGFDTRLKNSEDWEFCFRVALKYKVGFVGEVLVEYRNHRDNATKDVAEMERSTLIAWAKTFDTSDKNILRLRRRSYGNLHKVLAGSYLYNRQYDGFLRNLVKSLWFRPGYFGYYLGVIFARNRKS